jgi:hypothetical protein
MSSAQQDQEPVDNSPSVAADIFDPLASSSGERIDVVSQLSSSDSLAVQQSQREALEFADCEVAAVNERAAADCADARAPLAASDAAPWSSGSSQPSSTCATNSTAHSTPNVMVWPGTDMVRSCRATVSVLWCPAHTPTAHTLISANTVAGAQFSPASHRTH